MIKSEKEKAVEELQKVFAEAKGVYLADFTGIDVESINALRGQFRDANVNYRVIKNTLARLSIKDLNYDDLLPFFNGPTAIAYSYEDELNPGKVIEGFYKKTEKMSLKAAIVDGTVYDEATAKEIIKLPPKDQLQAIFLGTLKSPIRGFASVLNGILRNFVGVLDAMRDKMEKEGGELKPAEKTEDKAGAAEEAKPEEKPEAAEAPVEEKKTEDKAEAEPQEEKAEEKPAEKEKDEPAAEEKVEAEPVAEEVAEEPVAEEKAEEPVVEEKAEEPVAEEKAEEQVEDKKEEDKTENKE